MRDGDFEGAWCMSDRALQGLRRPDDAGRPRHLQRVWQGEPVAGKRVLVRCYHGLGDTIQFARFLPRLADITGETVVWCQPSLIPILRRVAPGLRFMPIHDGEPALQYDVDLEIMELGYVLRVSPAEAAAPVPYVPVEPVPSPSGQFNVGLVAHSGDWDGSRSIPEHLLQPLAGLGGVTIFSLLPGAHLAWATDLSSQDVLLAARRLKALDLVITVDTFMAHLAGAIGTRTWTLLPARADWRWLARGSSTPWYPGMRLLRQPWPGAWAPVAKRVLRDLRHVLHRRSTPAARLRPRCQRLGNGRPLAH